MKYKLFLFSVFVFSFWVQSARADVILPASIKTDLVLSAQGGPYLVNSKPLVIEEGVSVTLEPGAVVKFGSSSRLEVRGRLDALGLPDLPVTFTSSSTEPEPGKWGSIKFLGGSGSFENIIVEYGGRTASGNVPVIEVHSGPGVEIEGGVIRNNAGDGFRQNVLAVESRLENVSFENNGTANEHAAIRVWSGKVVLEDITTKGNGSSFICGDPASRHYRPVVEYNNLDFDDDPGEIYAAATLNNTCHLSGDGLAWRKDGYIRMAGHVDGEGYLSQLGLPIRFSMRSSFNQVNGTLNVAAGNHFQFAPYAGLTVNGVLNVHGTIDQPVKFTAVANEPKAEDWDGLRFTPSVAQDESVLRHVYVGGGGLGFAGTQYRRGEIYVGGKARVKFESLTLGPSSQPCLYIEEGGLVSIDHQSDLSACADNISNLPWVAPEVEEPEAEPAPESDPEPEPTAEPELPEPEAPTEEAPVGPQPSANSTRQIQVSVPSAPDPVIVIPGILGSWPKQGGLFGELELDPVLKTYDDLLKTLTLNGYVLDKTLHTFPYEWRNDNKLTADRLKEKIRQVLVTCSCQRVDIVAHSMGGLVARAYIQGSGYEDNVDQVIFLGTPHLGSTKAYLAWEGGVGNGGLADNLLETLLRVEARKGGFSNAVNYIRAKIQSINQLLPVYRYLSSELGKPSTPYHPCHPDVHPCNTFLEELNQSLPNLYERVRVENIANQSLPTLAAIVVGPKGPLPFWPHGQPAYKINLAGDGTVPGFSANLANQPGRATHLIQAEHRKLPSAARDLVVKLLQPEKRGGTAETITPVERVLLVSKFSPINIRLRDSQGVVHGYGVNPGIDSYYLLQEDREYIALSNPAQGEYLIEVLPNGQGEFRVEAILVADHGHHLLEFAGYAGQSNLQYGFVVSDNGLIRLEQEAEQAPTQTALAKVLESTPVVLGASMRSSVKSRSHPSADLEHPESNFWKVEYWFVLLVVLIGLLVWRHFSSKRVK